MLHNKFIKIVNEELTEILGSETSEIEKSPKIPTIIMMVGLQGAGKTTFAGKLANKLIKEQEARPMMIAADIYRPSSHWSVEDFGDNKSMFLFFDMGTETPAVEIVKKLVWNKRVPIRMTMSWLIRLVVCRLTRLSCKNCMILRNFAHPNEILLVVDSMIGQEAANVAKEFNEQLDITGVVLTEKLMGTTRGGAAPFYSWDYRQAN